METAARQLVFHGSIVLLIGLLCGAPYARAIKSKAAEQVSHAWKVAHVSLPIGGSLMFAVAPLLSSFSVAQSIKWSIVVTLIVSSYAFCVALPLGATVGHRGLSSDGPMSAKVVYLGNVIGAVASLAAGSILVYAGFVSL